MAKRRTHLSAVFAVTILITFVLVGGTLLILKEVGIFETKKQPSANTGAVSYTPMEFEADEEHNQTILFVLGDGESERGLILLLTRFHPTENRLDIVPVPTTMICQVGTERYTAYEFFRRGGEISVTKAVSQTLNIPVDRYLYLDNADFGEAADLTFGGVRYNLGADVIYENTELDEDVVIRSGTGNLSGSQIRQFLGSPEFTAEYRTQQTGFIFSDMINQAIGDRLYNSLDDSFTLIINKARTNISFQDYSFRKEAMENMIVPGASPAQVKMPSGEWAEDGTFTPSVAFRNELAAQFGVTPLEVLAE